MSIDVTKTDNYAGLSTANKTLVNTAITAIKAVFTGAKADRTQDNACAILREVINQQETT